MTLTELYKRTLQRLQVTAADESPSAEDGALVAARYAALWQVLRSHELVNWAVDEDVPVDVEMPLVNILAYACAMEFDSDPNMLAALAAEGAIGVPAPSLGERQLRRYLSRKHVPTPATPDYY